MSVFLDFVKNDVWKARPKAMSNGPFAMTPAPELASGEVVLSSLYRNIGFRSVGESDVPAVSRALREALREQKSRASKENDDAENSRLMQVEALLYGILDSPKQKNQNYVNVMPLTPYCATFSGAARLRGNPWNPGVLIHRMIWTGSRDAQEAADLWENLFDALSIEFEGTAFHQPMSEDAFAIWVEQTLREQLCATREDLDWAFIEKPALDVQMGEADYNYGGFPAKQFVEDLWLVLDLKPALTRRQWTSVLESLLRTASTSHVLWLCGVHANLASLIDEAVEGRVPTSAEQTRARLLEGATSSLVYDAPVMAHINERIRDYLKARLHITAVFGWLAERVGLDTGELSFSGSESIHAILETIAKNSSDALFSDYKNALREGYEIHERYFKLTSGVGKQMSEFLKYVPARMLVKEQALRSYDQGYVIEQPTGRRGAPYRVRFGPVTSLLMTYCALKGKNVPMGVSQLSHHLEKYGISIDPQSIGHSHLGSQLRTLGIVTDSPDAESGMLLSPPFITTVST